VSNDLALERGLPASLESERLVLGAILSGAEYQLVAGLLQVDDFSIEKHRRIFLRIGELYAAGAPITTYSVGIELQRQGQLESCDGITYLAELSDIPTLANLDYYCHVVKNKALARRTIFSAKALIDRLLLDQDTPAEALASAGEIFRKLEGETVPQATLRGFAEIIEANGGLNAYGRSGESAVRTPWPTLNRIIGGFQPGQMITIAGLTGSGKSAAALQIAIHAAEKQGLGVALFSLEMSANEIFERAACSRAGIDSKKLERGELSQDERHEFSRAAAELSKLSLWIDDSTNCTLPAMHAALRKHIQRHKIGLLLIDYLQLMQTMGKRENRTQEVTEISRGMKLAAREFGLPVVVLAQFNRGPAAEKREPQLHDLRESGSIEQDSDKVIFLHPKTRATAVQASEVSMIVAKQRNGKSRKYVNLLFVEQYARFEESTGELPSA
jgi:replicative DNA helicase